MSGRNIAAIAALTPSQEGILFHVIRDGARGAYHSQFSARIDAELDAQAWQAAWGAVVQRHDALRALFTWEGRDKPLQVIREQVDLPWQTLDWSHLDDAGQAAALEDWFARDRDIGFELDRAPLLRATSIRLGEGRYRFNLSFHHLIMDGWSMRLALDEARTLYNSPGTLPATAPSFTRFVEWLDKRDATGDAAAWKAQLSDVETPTFPDLDDGRPAAPDTTHVMTEEHLSDDDAAALQTLARELRTTPSSVVSAAWALVLSRYTGNHDVVFGSTVAGRPPELPDVESTVGLFINTLPLRLRVNEDATVADVIQHAHEAQVALRGLESASAIDAQRASAVPAGVPLFESILVYENFPAADAAATQALPVELDRFVEFSHFPLALLVVPDNPFRVIGISDPARIGSDALTALVRNVCHTLRAMTREREARVAALDILTPAQRREMVESSNDTRVEAPQPAAVWTQIVAQAKASPEQVALSDARMDVTYGQLVAHASAVAAQLRMSGIQNGDTVIVMGPRDALTVASAIGVMAAGAAYCPVAADAPAARLTRIVEQLQHDSRTVAALSSADAAGSLPDSVKTLELCWQHNPSTEASAPTVGPDDTAYIMFTSGSTGTPKGVAVTARNLFHSLHARDHYYGESPASFLLLSTLPTDSSIAGLFWTLARGGTLVLPPDRAEQDIEQVLALINDKSVSHLLTVPSLYAMLLEHLDGVLPLRTAIVAGEACPAALVKQHHVALPDADLHNEYGPTETTVWASAAQLQPDAPVTIGRPLANMRIYVVDEARRPVPLGATGELLIGGPQVARGYVGDAVRTAERFIDSPFVNGDRLYCTGDRVRLRHDGALTFVGRVDDQIKVRGFRVEPGEIESALRTHDAVDDVAVVLHAPASSAPRLVAWVTGTPTDGARLREHVASRLPAYMLPQSIEHLETLPRRPSGKVDRRALAARTPAAPAASDGGRAAPRTDAEKTLAAIWCAVLGADQVGIHDDFFALGGDSLLSIRVLARAGKAGLSLSPSDFFDNPTIAGQARAADVAPQRVVSNKPVVGPQALMPIQHWFFDHITSGRSHWNLSYLFDLHLDITLAHVQRALTAVLTHHDALRSAFELRDGQWHASTAPPLDAPVVSETSAQSDDEVHAHADGINASLQLDTPPLVRLCVVRRPAAQRDQLLIVAHHLVVDAESWRILVEDLSTALTAVTQNQAPALPPKTVALATYARRLAQWPIDSNREDGAGRAGDADQKTKFAHAFSASADYWQQRLALPYKDLLNRAAVPDNKQICTEANTLTRRVTLDRDTTQALGDAAREARASLNELLVASVARALGDHLDAPVVRFEVEGHGRDPLFPDLDVSRTVGWFTSSYPLIVESESGWQDAGGALRATKSAMRGLPDFGLGYRVLLAQDSDAARAVRDAGPADVLFNFLGERADDDGAVLTLRDDRCGRARADDATRAYVLEINAQIDDGELALVFAWPSAALNGDIVNGLGEQMLSTLRELCGNAGNTVVPEDFPLANLSAKGLSDLSDLLDDLDD